jgi:hypothetical protein
MDPIEQQAWHQKQARRHASHHQDVTRRARLVAELERLRAEADELEVL